MLRKQSTILTQSTIRSISITIQIRITQKLSTIRSLTVSELLRLDLEQTHL
jgi:hypothetical protein